SCFDDLRDDLRSELDAITEGHAGPAGARPVAVIFAHADRNRPVYRAVCGRAGGTAFTHRLQRLFAGLLHEHLASAGTRLPVELVAEFHAGALLGALVWWVRQDFPYGPKEMAEMCRQLTAAGVQAGLEREHN
ncbi:TetR-like C-terminal domain-containing protein, partial [Actinoplanes nipponensis]